MFVENIRRNLKKPYKIFPYIYLHYNRRKIKKDIKKKREKINQTNLIWHFCTPKSASSYLSYLLNLNTKKHVSAIPFYYDRQQITDFSYLYSRIIENKFNSGKVFFVHHQHTTYDSLLGKYISKKHKVIIQHRNIYKTVLSLKNYIISKNLINANPFARWDHTKYKNNDILKLIIFNYVPFHINFIKTWVESKVKGKKIFVSYESFIKNERNYLEKIFNGYERENIIIPKLENINKREIKFNKTIKRENNLNIDEVKLIDEIVDIHTKHSDPMIKSLIYENL